MTITPAMRSTFREQGFVVVPGVLSGEQVQTFGTAGSVLFAHYLLGHRNRWREVVADPLSEFRGR